MRISIFLILLALFVSGCCTESSGIHWPILSQRENLTQENDLEIQTVFFPNKDGRFKVSNHNGNQISQEKMFSYPSPPFLVEIKIEKSKSGQIKAILFINEELVQEMFLEFEPRVLSVGKSNNLKYKRESANKILITSMEVCDD